MDLKHLQHLVLLAEELNFGRAAQRAHLSQSAFTRSIQALELLAGMPLFDRGKRFVRITATGQRTLERARHLLGAAQDLAVELEHLRTGAIGSVAVGGGPHSSAMLLVPLLAALHRAHPGVATRVEVGSWSNLLANLRAERLDFFIGNVHDVRNQPELALFPLGKLHGALFCRPGHPLLAKKRVLPADVVACRIATVTLLDEVKQAFSRALPPAPTGDGAIAFESDNLEGLTEVTRHTDMLLGTIPATVETALARGELCRLEVAGVDYARTFYTELGLVRLAGRSLAPAGETLCRMVREAARQMVSPDGWLERAWTPGIDPLAGSAAPAQAA
jgi:DNA-binding transcriptional LysR family regulator